MSNNKDEELDVHSFINPIVTNTKIRVTMSKNNLSSIDWYVKELNILGDEVFKTGITFDEYYIKKNKLIEQAKEMQKDEQIKIIQFIIQNEELTDCSSISKETAEHYLNEFNNQKNKI